MPALEAGALSYLLKNVDPHEIVAAIKKASIGEIVLHPLIAARLIQNLKVKQPPPEIVLRKLSKREKRFWKFWRKGFQKPKWQTSYLSVKTRLNRTFQTLWESSI